MLRENKSHGFLHRGNYISTIYPKLHAALWAVSPNVQVLLQLRRLGRHCTAYPCLPNTRDRHTKVERNQFSHCKQCIHLFKSDFQVNPNQTTDITGYQLRWLKYLLQSQSLLLCRKQARSDGVLSIP